MQVQQEGLSTSKPVASCRRPGRKALQFHLLLLPLALVLLTLPSAAERFVEVTTNSPGRKALQFHLLLIPLALVLLTMRVQQEGLSTSKPVASCRRPGRKALQFHLLLLPLALVMVVDMSESARSSSRQQVVAGRPLSCCTY